MNIDEDFLFKVFLIGKISIISESSLVKDVSDISSSTNPVLTD